MPKDFEDIIRKNMENVRAASMAAGMLSSLRIIQTFYQQENKSDSEILSEIKSYIENSLNQDTYYKQPKLEEKKS